MDLPILCKQAYWLGGWLAHVEIDVRLFVAFGVLLSPQLQQERGQLGKDILLCSKAASIASSSDTPA